MKEGDKNTSFFHKMDNAHKRRNHMSRLKINVVWYSEGVGLKEQVVSAFQGLLYDPKEWKPSSIGLSFQRLDVAEASCLENPFTEEVFMALEEFCGDKVLGPDGFSMDFWQSS